MSEAADLACRLCGGVIATPASRCPYCGREIMAVCPGCKRYVDNRRSECPDCGAPLTRMADVASELARKTRIQRPPAPPPQPQGLVARLIDQVRTWRPLAPAQEPPSPSAESEPPTEAESPAEGVD